MKSHSKFSKIQSVCVFLSVSVCLHLPLSHTGTKKLLGDVISITVKKIAIHLESRRSRQISFGSGAASSNAQRSYEVPQARLKTREMYSIRVLEATRQKSSWGQNMLSLKALRKDPSLPLLASNGCQQSLAFLALQMHQSNLCLCLSMACSPVCLFSVSKSPSSLKDTNYNGFKPHPKPGWPHLNSITSAKTLTKLHPQIPRWHYST